MKMFRQKLLIYLLQPLSRRFLKPLNLPIQCLRTFNVCLLQFRPLLPTQYLVPYQFRSYAKGKDKKKDKGKSKVQVNENQINEILDLESYKANLQTSLDQLKDDFTKQLSLRSTTGSIELIRVNVDGKDLTLQEVAQIIRKNPKTIVLNMSAFPQAIPSAMKCIQKSGMNLNPQQDGTTIYIPVPKVTKDHRENLSKNAKSLFVKCRDAMKDAQNKQTKNVKKKDGVSEDVCRNVEQQLIHIANEYVKQAESVLVAKQNELLSND